MRNMQVFTYCLLFALAGVDRSGLTAEIDQPKNLELINVDFGDSASIRCIATWPDRTSVVALTEDGKLLQWNASQTRDIADNLRGQPAQLNEFVSLVCRERSVTSLGIRQGKAALATYRMDKEYLSAEWVSGQSVNLKNLEDAQPLGSAATPVAIYIASQQQDTFAIWRVNAGVATLGGPRKLHSGPEPVKALTLNYQGHLLVAALNPESQTIVIRFHHADTGKMLLELPTRLTDVASLAIGRDELLYAAASVDGSTGLFRLDVAYENRQVIREKLLQPLAGIRQVAASKDSLFLLINDSVQRMKLATVDQ